MTWRQGLLFGGMRWREEFALRRHGAVPWTQSICLTSLVRLPPDVGAEISNTLRPLIRSEHYLHPRPSLHVTVLNLDVPVTAGLSLARIITDVQRAVDSSPPLELEVRGLSLSRWTAYARVHSQALPHLRRRLRAALGCNRARIRDELGFCNVLRFQGPVDRAVGDWVRNHRRSRFGSWEAPQVEIVRTDKVFSAAATQTLATVQR